MEIVFCNVGKEQKIVSTMIKKFTDSNEEGWYGTKEELKESEDFYPFILIKLGVPFNILFKIIYKINYLFKNKKYNF